MRLNPTYTPFLIQWWMDRLELSRDISHWKKLLAEKLENLEYDAETIEEWETVARHRRAYFKLAEMHAFLAEYNAA